MKKILIVDDEAAYPQLLSDKLTEKYTVFIAEDGEKGLAAAEKEHPDLILLDISMPVMSGLEMLKALRKTSFGEKVKVMLLTNLEPTQEIIHETLSGEPTSYIIKSDMSRAEIVEKIDAALAE